MTETLKSHPAADMFPMMSSKEFDELKADIKRNGLLEPIHLYEGMIIDGRNRLRACCELRLEPKFREYDGNSPVAFVWSINGTRRHLTTSQLGAVAVKMLPPLQEEARKRQEEHRNTAPGRSAETLTSKKSEVSGEATEVAAKIVGVSGSTVRSAKYVAENSPEEFDRIVKGEVTVGGARNKLRGTETPTETKLKRIEKIRQLASAGNTSRQISDVVGVTHHHVRLLARKADIQLPDTVAAARKINAHRVIEATVDGLEGYTLGLTTLNGSISDIEPETANEWVESLSSSLRALYGLKKKLLEISNGA